MDIQIYIQTILQVEFFCSRVRSVLKYEIEDIETLSIVINGVKINGATDIAIGFAVRLFFVLFFGVLICCMFYHSFCLFSLFVVGFFFVSFITSNCFLGNGAIYDHLLGLLT